jgi:hypothetical protein
MIDIKKVRDEAEAEFREEQAKKAKEKLKDLLRKRALAKAAVANIDREIDDATAELGKGTAV